jgi:hypothetical protein
MAILLVRSREADSGCQAITSGGLIGTLVWDGGSAAAVKGGDEFLHSAHNLVGDYHGYMGSTLKDMATWTDLIGHAQLRSLVDGEGHFWLEQNATKQTKWAKLAREEHDVAWEFAGRGGSYTGRMLIDGEIYTPSEATKKFLQTDNK